MLTVYAYIRSGNCLKVKWLLDWLGRDYRWIETDVMSGVTRSGDPCPPNPAIVAWIGRVEDAFGIR